MKNEFLKIIALFFLTILLSSNVLNVHTYLHQKEVQNHLTDSCSGNNDEEQELPCELCHFALQLHNLDYNNSLEFSYENNLQVWQRVKTENFSGNDELAEQRFYNRNRNKAPPALI